MLPIKKIDKIRSLYFDEGMKIIDISMKLNCSTNTVSKYVKNFDCSPNLKNAQMDCPKRYCHMKMISKHY